MMEERDDIRRQVQERIEAERASLAAAAPPAKSPVDSAFISQCLQANELGDGALYAAIHRNRFLYCTSSAEWYAWSGHHWERDVMGRSLAAVEDVVDQYLIEYKRASAEIAELLAKGESPKSDAMARLKSYADALLARARQLRGVRRRTNCLEFARTLEDPIAAQAEDFDQRPLLFPCANGVLDLETGLLHPGRPDDLLTLASPVDWRGIDEACPLWERTLLEIFAGNEPLVSYLQRILGYAMTGLVQEKVFPVLYGPTGWNGRSLIIETVSHVMGALAGSIPAEMLLSQKFAKNSAAPTPDILSLKGMRMAFASEIDEGQKFSAAKIKWLTGKDELIGRNPHDKHPVRFYPTHKLFLMTNTQPEAPPNDKAFWERVHLITFTISFVNRDPQVANERRAVIDLDRLLLAEASGILAWLVRGCLEYLRRGLDPPVEILRATEEYRQGEDVLADFIDECCLVEDGAKESANTIYKRYVAWYQDNIGEKPRSGTWFGKQLKLRFLRTKVNGRSTYHGIAIKDGQGEMET